MLAKRARHTDGGLTAEALLQLRGQNPDVVLISEGGCMPPVELLETLVARHPRVAMVSHANYEHWWPSDDSADRYRSALEKLVKHFFVSRTNLELARRQYSYEFPRAEVVRNPVSVPFDINIPWPTISAMDQLRLACVGRLFPTAKGQDILLRALAKESWRDRNWRLTFYGGGECRRGLENLTRHLGLSERVIFAGHSDIQEIWRDNHILALTSRYEGLPIVIVEAMLCQRPVLTTDIAGNAELLEEGRSGFIADSPSLEAVIGALERCWVRRSHLREMGEAAHRDVVTRVPREADKVFAGALSELVQ